MKVLYVGPYAGETDIVSKSLAGHEITYVPTLAEVKDDVRSEIEILSVFVNTPVDSETLESFPKLKLIAARSTGYDHIDCEAARALDVTVVHVPHYGTQTVAEFAFALMFALSRNVYRAYSDMQAQTNVATLEAYEGFDMAGKTLGIIGTGAIGKHACKIACGLGMKVLAYDIYPNEELAEHPSVEYVDLSTLSSQADIVTVHVPSIPATHHLINEEILTAMKPTAYLINTARGDVVDTHALVKALKSKSISGAGLDVLEGEHDLHDELELLTEGNNDQSVWRTLIADHALIDMQNVIVTPHIAFNTREAKKEITDSTTQNISAYIAGEVTNQVT